mmetsp:Transcript_52914/g.138776  ORF Transcript_52914/g.138776 Transcript_52914/m.138776 type:complete len:238 (+) Transcript_52914:43-756(+)
MWSTAVWVKKTPKQNIMNTISIIDQNNVCIEVAIENTNFLNSLTCRKQRITRQTRATRNKRIVRLAAPLECGSCLAKCSAIMSTSEEMNITRSSQFQRLSLPHQNSLPSPSVRIRSSRRYQTFNKMAHVQYKVADCPFLAMSSVSKPIKTPLHRTMQPLKQSKEALRTTFFNDACITTKTPSCVARSMSSFADSAIDGRRALAVSAFAFDHLLTSLAIMSSMMKLMLSWASVPDFFN